MTKRTSIQARLASLAGMAALGLGLLAAAPAEAAGARGLDDGGAALPRAASHHHRARLGAGAWRHRTLASRPRHRHARFVAVRPGPQFGVAGVPAGYASDESPYNVQAEDDDFDTGAFYGCLHNVLTAGGYRPEASCY